MSRRTKEALDMVTIMRILMRNKPKYGENRVKVSMKVFGFSRFQAKHHFLASSGSTRLYSSSPLKISNFSIFKLRLIQNLKIISFILTGIIFYDAYDLFVNKNNKDLPISIAKSQNKKSDTANARELMYEDLLQNDINLYYLDNLVVKQKVNRLIKEHLFLHPDEKLVLNRRKLATPKKIGPVDQRFESLKISIPSEENKQISWYDEPYIPVKYLTFSYSRQNPDETDEKWKLKVSTNVKLTMNPVNVVSKVLKSIQKGTEESSKTPEKEAMYLPNGGKEESNADGGLHLFPSGKNTRKEYTLFVEDKLYINNDPNRQLFYSCSITNDMHIKISYLKYSYRNKKTKDKWISEVIASP